MDFGTEEIEFYILNYPKAIGMDWEIEQALKPELDAVSVCMPDKTLFLNASEETPHRSKRSDTTRSQNFFDHYLQHFLPLKKAWFIGRPDVDVLDVDDLTPEELGQKVKEWVRGRNQSASEGKFMGSMAPYQTGRAERQQPPH